MSGSISVNTYSETSIGTAVETSTGDQTSTVEVYATTVVGTQMPDDSESVSASLGATGDAFGEDTLTYAGVSGVASDDGAVASVDIQAEALAVSQSSSGDGTFAVAITEAYLSDGAELSFISTVESAYSVSDAEDSVSIAYSETSMMAVDVDLSDIGGGGGTDIGGTDAVPTIEPDAVDAPAVASDEPELSESPPAADLMDLIDIDGNIAIVDVDVTVNSNDSFVEVDAFAMTFEDELSTSVTSVDLALSV